MQALELVLGDYATRTPTATLLVKADGGIPNDVARLKGARFVYAAEAEEGKRLAEAFIKDVTGGDKITARFLRAEYFEFFPEFKLWLGTNHKPVIRGTDKAIWDRIKLVPFNVRIETALPRHEVAARLRAEAPGILAWAVGGCLEWLRAGLGEPEEVRSATESYRGEMDTLAAFLEDRCLLDANARATARQLYEAYKDWCEQNNEHTLSQKWFGQRLQERGCCPTRGAHGGPRGWSGIGLAASPVLLHSGGRVTASPRVTDGDALRGSDVAVPIHEAETGKACHHASPLAEASPVAAPGREEVEL